MATIRVRAGFFPMAFLLFFFAPRVRIDGGDPQKIGWFSEAEFDVTPGTHRVFVDHPYFVSSWNHPAETDVTVGAGQTVSVKYRARVLAFLRGKISVS